MPLIIRKVNRGNSVASCNELAPHGLKIGLECPHNGSFLAVRSNLHHKELFSGAIFFFSEQHFRNMIRSLSRRRWWRRGLRRGRGPSVNDAVWPKDATRFPSGTSSL